MFITITRTLQNPQEVTEKAITPFFQPGQVHRLISCTSFLPSSLSTTPCNCSFGRIPESLHQVETMCRLHNLNMEKNTLQTPQVPRLFCFISCPILKTACTCFHRGRTSLKQRVGLCPKLAPTFATSIYDSHVLTPSPPPKKNPDNSCSCSHKLCK